MKKWCEEIVVQRIQPIKMQESQINKCQKLPNIGGNFLKVCLCFCMWNISPKNENIFLKANGREKKSRALQQDCVRPKIAKESHWSVNTRTNSSYLNYLLDAVEYQPVLFLFAFSIYLAICAIPELREKIKTVQRFKPAAHSEFSPKIQKKT